MYEQHFMRILWCCFLHHSSTWLIIFEESTIHCGVDKERLLRNACALLTWLDSGVGLGYFRLFGGMTGVHVFQTMFPKYCFSQLRFDKWWGHCASDNPLSSVPREQLVCVASWITRIRAWKEGWPPRLEGGAEPRELS